MPQTENYIEMRERLSRLDMQDIFTKVSECLEVDYNFVMSKTRKREAADVRKIAIKFCLEILNYDVLNGDRKLGYSGVASFLKLKHSDIIHLYKTCNNYIESNNIFRQKYERCIHLKPGFVENFNRSAQPTKRDEFLIIN